MCLRKLLLQYLDFELLVPVTPKFTVKLNARFLNKIKTNMALDEETLMYLLILYHRRKRRICNKYRKIFWVRKLFQHRRTRGEFDNLVRELKLHDHELF